MAQDARALLRRFEALKTARTSSENYWQQVADYILPSREFTRHTTPGNRRTAPLIFNTTPTLACEQLAGALHGMLTSPSLRWFALRPSDPVLAANDDVRAWFEAATDVLYGAFTSTRSGFDTALHELYLELAGFGTGCLFVADRGRLGPFYEARPLAEIYVAQGADGKIDTLFRCSPYPARDVVKTWPDTTPDKIKALAEKTPDAPVMVVHTVVPIGDEKWCNAYILQADGSMLEDGPLFNGFPFAVPRWMKRSGETYGFGPGQSVLPDVKLLNKLEEINLRGLAKMIDPPLMVPDDGFLNSVVTSPGAINYYRSGSMNLDKVGPLLTGGRPDLGKGEIELRQDRVRRGFYVDWMNLPQQPNMTATEVLQRRDEMLRILGPMVARVTGELLGPVITRSFNILAANGFLPPPPEALRGQGYHVEYLSPLAMAQKASDAEAVMRWATAMGQLAQVDQTVLQVVDAEAAARFLANRLGAPAAVVRSPEALAQMRQQAAQREAQQHEMAAAGTVADTAQKGSAALVNLSQVLQQRQGQGQTPGQAPGQGQAAAA